MGHRIAAIHHSPSSLAGSEVRGKGAVVLGGQKNRGQGERGEGVWEDRSESDGKTWTYRY